ncbi:glycoside hydrolase domain-containing protein [Enterobacter sp. CP102]|uniref:glycoside hydrolase domain-containing protein n=1 Tax=Enterobacter sp. CP102 TaxID=2976431 RepID=UPI0021FF092D|nr:glycoside hydrolase domain-containing protein [Enterobacter sp. CP102]UWM66002.1 DUF1906 domain-containing protein [Enterobacter sp. CP102]
MSIIDTPYNTKNIVSCLLREGVSTVIRYYNFSNSISFPEKRLTLPEAEMLSQKGIDIGVVFQQKQNEAGDFNYQKGFSAGRRAYRYARDDINQPVGSGIYFSVDFDATKKEITTAIVPFFEGIRDAFLKEKSESIEYDIGVYGSGFTAETLKKADLISLVWLAMSSGFQGTKAAQKSGAFNLNQQYPSGNICGIGVDYNHSNPDGRGIGTFRLPHVQQQFQLSNTITEKSQFKVIARNGLRVRRGPGVEFDVAGIVQKGTLLSVIKIEGQWALVDIEGDGMADGYVFAGYLEKR